MMKRWNHVVAVMFVAAVGQVGATADPDTLLPELLETIRLGLSKSRRVVTTRVS